MKKRSVIGWFIPDSLKDDVDKRIRSRQLVIFCLISPSFFIPNIIKWSKLGSQPLAVSVVVVMLLILLFLLLFKKIKSLGVFGNLIFAALAWHFTFLPFCTGGIHSSALTWNPVVPILAAAFVGVRSSVFWTCVMLVEVGVFIALETAGISTSTVHLEGHKLVEVQAANIIGPLLAMVLSIFPKGGEGTPMRRSRMHTGRRKPSERNPGWMRNRIWKRLSIFLNKFRETPPHSTTK